MKRSHLFAVISFIAALAAGYIVWDAWQSQSDANDVLRRPMESSYRHVRSLYGDASDPFEEPQDVAVLPGGEIAVADTGNGRVVVLDSDGKKLRVIGRDGGSALRQPSKLAVQGDSLLVVDPVLREVRRYSAHGDLLGRPVRWKDGRIPSAVATDESGRIFVADVAGHVISVLDSEGKQAGTLGRERPPAGFPQMRLEDGRLDYPNGLAVDDSGRVWVADSNNERMQLFDVATGEASSPAPSGDSVPPMSLPRDVSIGADGRAFVADPLGHRVFVLNESGQAMAAFGTMGLRDGELFLPLGVATDDRGRVFIAEKGANRVSVFSAPVLADVVSFAFPPRVALPLALIAGALVIAGALLLPKKRLVLGTNPSRATRGADVKLFSRSRSAALSIDLSKCLECRACEKACAAAFGAARFQLDEGNRSGDLWNPRACRLCRSQSCVGACPVGAMRVDERGVAVVGSGCIGCGACARACPFGGIQMMEIGGEPRPAKCDLCPGRATPACVAGCPTGAFSACGPQTAVGFTEAALPCGA